MSELRDFDRMFRLDGKVALITGGECDPLASDRKEPTDVFQ
jgi:hypothetical protein